MNFALIGAGGYIAPRHMKAIKDTGHVLVAALDKHDSVGILDSYFPKTAFFIEPERFDRHLDKLRRMGTEHVDFVSVCSPNFLHDAHIRLAIRNEAHAICEKPVVLNPWNIESLVNLEKETGKNIYTILQLRHHPAIIELKNTVQQNTMQKKHDIILTYITSRGRWYKYSWKGDVTKSGGIATNIGIHFFDMLSWIFGSLQESKVHLLNEDKAAGFLELEHARVKWFLSIDENDIPEKQRIEGKRTFRSIVIENKEIEFSEGFTDLHTVSYQNILSGTGFKLKDAEYSVQIAHAIRNASITGLSGEYHPFINK